jgi:putative colanic acid biosynthesis UDP-glucose lipid carrier transferase
LLTERNSPTQSLHSQLAPATLVRIALDPLVAIGMLLVCALASGQRFNGHYLILVILVFALTFPGTSIRSVGAASLAREILGNWCVTLLLLLLVGWATQSLDVFDHRLLLVWAIATPVALFFAHRFAPPALGRWLAAENMQRVAVIAGADELGRRHANGLRNSPYGDVRLAGFFDDRGEERRGEVQPGEFLGSLAQLPRYAKSHRVDLIYITLPMTSRPRILSLLDELCDTTASIYFAPDVFVFDLIQARVDAVGEIPVVAVCETPFYGFNGLVKRVSDIVLATLILILAAPLMLGIAIGVKLSSPGPALFRQRRYGVDGREIVVYKFRSMTVFEDGDTVKQATRNDARVTPFGAFLRRSSLDELPQFINVLQGRMSVVGPRPHAVAHNEMYRKLIKRYMIRHKVKPGITGLAQVNGLRGETESVDKMQLRIEYDLAYLRDWSLRLDLQIVLRTVLVVLRRHNAY